MRPDLLRCFAKFSNFVALRESPDRAGGKSGGSQMHCILILFAYPELFISKEEAEAVGYRAEDEKNKTQQDLAEEDAETELVLAAQEV